MSPTSYQTAPPRGSSITRGPRIRSLPPVLEIARNGQVTCLLREASGLNIGHLEEELKLEPNQPVTRFFYSMARIEILLRDRGPSILTTALR